MWDKEYINRQEIIQALANIRREWEEAADGEPLEFVEGSVGLLLDDVARAIGLDQEKPVAAQVVL